MSDVFKHGPAPPHGDKLVQELKRMCPDIFLVCFRSKNKNVFIYQARVDANRCLMDPPVESYWLILEPSYQEARKKKGIKHDHEEPNFLDNRFAWGFKAKRMSDKKCTFEFSMYSHELHVQVDEKGSKLFTNHNSRKYYLRTLYIESSEHLKLINIRDNVKRLKLDGFDITETPYKPGSVILK